ncbi:MAG: hypothetical protein RIR18_426 [Pseudomonadota bacterium]|jgi:hypothetical protein
MADQQELLSGNTVPAERSCKLISEKAFPEGEMTDEQFEDFARIENNEIPLGGVNFKKKLRTVIRVR